MHRINELLVLMLSAVVLCKGTRTSHIIAISRRLLRGVCAVFEIIPIDVILIFVGRACNMMCDHDLIDSRGTFVAVSFCYRVDY